MVYQAKKATVRAAMLAFGAAFETISKRSPELKAEIAGWDEGRVFSLGVLPDGPAVAFQKKGDRIQYLGKGHHDSTLTILFKNMDAALLPLTFRIGTDTSYAQRRGILYGNIAQGMQLTRAMGIVQSYLLPHSILEKTCKRAPTLTPGQFRLKIWVMATLLFGMVFRLAR